MNDEDGDHDRVCYELARLGYLRSDRNPRGFHVLPIPGGRVRLHGGWFVATYHAARLARILATLEPCDGIPHATNGPGRNEWLTKPEFWGAVRAAEVEAVERLTARAKGGRR